MPRLDGELNGHFAEASCSCPFDVRGRVCISERESHPRGMVFFEERRVRAKGYGFSSHRVGRVFGLCRVALAVTLISALS